MSEIKKPEDKLIGKPESWQFGVGTWDSGIGSHLTLEGKTFYLKEAKELQEWLANAIKWMESK